MIRCDLRNPLIAVGLLALAAWGVPGCTESPSSARNDERAKQSEPLDPTAVAAVEHLYDATKGKSVPEVPPSAAGLPSSKQSSAGTAKVPDANLQVQIKQVPPSEFLSTKPQPGKTSEGLDRAGGLSYTALSGKNLPNGVGPKGNPVNPRILSAAKAAPAPRKIEILVKERKFVPDGPDGALRVLYEDLDLLRVINMEPVTADCEKSMPEWLKELNGKKVRIRGFMAPTFTETGIVNFVMARDTQACCFGPNTKIYHLIDVHMKSGLTAEFLPYRPLEVQGTFHIEPKALDDGMMLRLYVIDDAEIVAKK